MGSEETTDGRYSLAQKLSWLILARLTAAVVLFVARGLWFHGRNAGAWPESLAPLLIVAALTLLYALARTFSKALLLQARTQFLIDIALVTWLVWITDVIHSPYIAIYIVVIAASSLFLAPRDAVFISLGCAITFTASALLVLNGFGRVPPGELLDSQSGTDFSVDRPF